MQVISVVLAAGASTRMKSSRSKLLHSLMGETIAFRAYRLARSISDADPIFVLGHQRDEIVEDLNSKGAQFQECLQENPLGTADAVRKALPHLEKYSDEALVFIMPGDAILLQEASLQIFKDQHVRAQAQLSLMSFELPNPGSYGRVVRDQQSRVRKIVEFKNASEEEKRICELNSGFYLVRLDRLISALEKISKNEQTLEYYFTDIVELIASESGLVQSLLLQDPAECLGINTQLDLSVARMVMRNRINTRWQLLGVEMEDPQTTFVDESVELSPDVFLGAGVHLKGKTRVQGPSKIEAYSVIQDSEIGPRCEVGPFARLRPGTRLESDVKVGNFVEAKKSRFGRGSKAGHLSYLGDTEVGDGANIGAGTITCNYDGVSKYETKIGKNVFVGSNTSLVAPVVLGDSSIVGAGSVITKDVQAESLAISRAEQSESAGGATRFRAKKKKGH